MLILAGFGLLAPIFDGYSIMDLGERCRTVQPVAGLLEMLGLGDLTGGQCDDIHRITLGIYGFGAIGLIVLIVGAVVRR